MLGNIYHRSLTRCSLYLVYIVKEGKAIAIQTVEAINGPLDQKTFLPMVSVINQLPDDADLKTRSYPEIRQELETRDILYSVKHPLGAVVALAGAVVEQDGKTVRLTEIAANSRADSEATHELMDEFVTHVKQQGADQLVLDVTPQPGTTAEDFVERYGISPDRHGAYILSLADVQP